ncbi:MAG: DNA damage-inducible protein D, partial [Patescibacteria group bacterium]
FANEITIFNLKKDTIVKNLTNIISEHEQNNRDVRQLLIQKEIIPENLPAEEDVKKIQRKLRSDSKLIIKSTKKLTNEKTKQKTNV